MTDREKIESVFLAFDIPVEDAEGSFVAADRRYFFDAEGVLIKVIERAMM